VEFPFQNLPSELQWEAWCCRLLLPQTPVHFIVRRTVLQPRCWMSEWAKAYTLLHSAKGLTFRRLLSAQLWDTIALGVSCSRSTVVLSSHCWYIHHRYHCRVALLPQCSCFLNTMPAGTSMCDRPGWGEADVLGLEVSLNCLQPGLVRTTAQTLPILLVDVDGGLKYSGEIVRWGTAFWHHKATLEGYGRSRDRV